MSSSDSELPASTAPTTSGPRVSVIVTFYNQASFVFGALDSVNDQTADNIQLIITDDGSTDDTASLIDRWVSENRPDAVVVRPPANVGLPAVLNQALEHVHGDFICVMGGDDEMMPERVERQAQALEEFGPAVGLVYSDLLFVDENDEPTGEKRPDPERTPWEGDVLERFIADNYLPGGGAIMFRRQLIETIGAWREDLVAEDFDFLLRAAAVTEFRYVPYDCLRYRVLPGTLTSRIGAMAYGRAESLLQHRSSHPELAAAIDERVGRETSTLHEIDYNRVRTRRLLVRSILRTRRPKYARQLAQSMARVGRRSGETAARSVSAWPLNRVEAMAGPLRRSVGIFAAGSLLAGIIEATLLVIIAALATSLTSGEAGTVSLLGPLDIDLGSTQALIILGAVLLVMYPIAEAILGRHGARLFGRTTYRIRRHVLETYARSSWTAKEPLEGSGLVHLATGAAGKVGGTVNEMAAVIAAGINFAVLMITALLIHPTAAILAVAAIGVVTLVTVPLTVVAARIQQSTTDSLHAYLREIEQHSALSREIEVFGAADAAAATIDPINAEQARLISRARFMARFNTTIFKTAGLTLVLVLLAIVSATNPDDLTSLAAVALVLLRAVSYGQAVQRGWHATAEASPWIDTLESALSALECEAGEAPHQPEPIETNGPIEVELDSVSFSYVPGVPVLHGVSHTFEAGSITGVIGPSGAGKSTLAELLLGLRHPDTGMLRIDSEAVSATDRSRRTSVAYVPQEPALIRGSIMDNVRFHRPWISDAAIVQALHDANVHGDIVGWPDGLETDPGTLGNRLSGGQKQRIAIARALAGAPRLLVLDEPTSALDQRSEAAIADLLAGLRGSVTVVVISHRPETLAGCDHVLDLAVANRP